MMRALVVLLSAIVACSGCSSSGSRNRDEQTTIVLEWTSSDVAEDGSPVTDLSGYRLEFDHTNIVLPPDVLVRSVVVSKGTWKFRVVAMSKSRGESASNEVVVSR